jgi:hypothetical protein
VVDELARPGRRGLAPWPERKATLGEPFEPVDQGAQFPGSRPDHAREARRRQVLHGRQQASAHSQSAYKADRGVPRCYAFAMEVPTSGEAH